MLSRQINDFSQKRNKIFESVVRPALDFCALFAAVHPDSGCCYFCFFFYYYYLYCLCFRHYQLSGLKSFWLNGLSYHCSSEGIPSCHWHYQFYHFWLMMSLAAFGVGADGTFMATNAIFGRVLSQGQLKHDCIHYSIVSKET